MAKAVECIECGETLIPEQVQAHLSSHWGDAMPDPIRYPEAHRRYMHLWAFADDAGVVVQRRQNSL